MQVLYALLLSSALAGLALWKRALTPGGTTLAWALCLLITAYGGGAAFAILAVTLLGTVAADRFAGERTDPNSVRRKSGSRDAVRVLCNVGVAGCAMLLCAITGWKGFLLAYAGVMAESLADSLASKLGPLSKSPPRDIITLKPIPAGLSGGVSLVGTLSELLGAAVVALVFSLGTGNPKALLTVTLAGFLGATFDSVLGSRAQAKYLCSVCGTVTERETHCGKDTRLTSGLRWLNNDAVNFLSNLFSLMLALLLAI